MHFWSYSKGELKNSYGERSQSGEEYIWNSQNLILASSHLVRRSDRTKQLLDAQPWDLVILDEAHHARRPSPQNPKETPNRWLQLMQQLKEKSRSLLLLSATPMQINTLEVFDLLQLLGLRGHWSYGKNFCTYFSTWHLMTFYPDIFDENASLQLMSFGNPLFEEMLEDLAPRPNCP